MITTGPDGALWFTNWDTPSIGRITTAGKVTTFTGAIESPASIAASRSALWYTNWSAGSIGRMTTRGASKNYTAKGMVYPQNITTGPGGALWFTANNAIGRITTKGQVTRYAVPHGLATVGADIAAGPDGAIWFTDPARNAIGRLSTSR